MPRLSRPCRPMHFGDISSDHVTRNAYAARNNEAWGLGKVITIKVVMIQDTKLQPLMTDATTSCCKPICSVSLGETSMASGRFTICWRGNWLVCLGHSTSCSSLEKKFDRFCQSWGERIVWWFFWCHIDDNTQKIHCMRKRHRATDKLGRVLETAK